MKIFKHLLFTLFSLVLVANLTAQKNNNVAKEERTVEKFTSVSVGGGIDLYISQGNSNTIEVKADDNAIDKLVTEVDNGTLKIYFDRNIRRVKKSEVYIEVNDLERIHASGGSDVESKGKLKFERLEINSSGGSDVELELEVRELICNPSGGSDVELEGSADRLALRASGGSDFDGYDFKVKEATISASGGSDSNVYVSESIEVNASGASDVNFKGNPRKTKLKSSGASDISSQK